MSVTGSEHHQRCHKVQFYNRQNSTCYELLCTVRPRYSGWFAIRTPSTLRCSCVTQADLGAWRLHSNYRPLARRVVGEGVTRRCGMSQARGLADNSYLYTVFEMRGGGGQSPPPNVQRTLAFMLSRETLQKILDRKTPPPNVLPYFAHCLYKHMPLFPSELKHLWPWLCRLGQLLVLLWATGQPCWPYEQCMNVYNLNLDLIQNTDLMCFR